MSASSPPDVPDGPDVSDFPDVPDAPDGLAAPALGAEDPSRWDCQACGACCHNLDSNLASGVRYWVEIAATDKILTRQDLMRKLVTHDRNRVPHLRMNHDGTCEALRGTIGKKVSCSIYHQRPSPCRRVMPGDETCLLSRAARGIGAPAAG
jgi:Fe-S-cluster containining protein